MKENNMRSKFKVLTILGSPRFKKSNTRAMVEDFVEDMKEAGLDLDHQIISLGCKKVQPCIGCWNCTNKKPCPQSKKDDLEEIKAAMLDCDMLILACPVYTNDVTAQMKAFFDRLFTWCHIFPLLGKYSLSACTTGNDGHKETGFFLEKMLATYGTYSFGNISSTGGFISGDFPKRDFARKQNKKLAQKAARTILSRKKLPVSRLQKNMFKVMKRKIMGIHTINVLRYGHIDGQPNPSWLQLLMMKKIFNRMDIGQEQITRWAGYIAFEYGWWKDLGWLNAKSFKDLHGVPFPEMKEICCDAIHRAET